MTTDDGQNLRKTITLKGCDFIIISENDGIFVLDNNYLTWLDNLVQSQTSIKQKECNKKVKYTEKSFV